MDRFHLLTLLCIKTLNHVHSMSKGKIQNDTFISAFINVGQWADYRKQLIEGVLWDRCNEDDWMAAFKLLHTRIKTRFLNPIDWILEKRSDVGEGFSVVALQCILIEFLEATYQGKIYTTSRQPRPFEYNSSKQLFSDFLLNHKPFSEYFKSKANANGFFDNIRCGLLHEAATKEKSRINNAPSHNMLVLFEANDPRNMRIYRENFYRAILEFIEEYRVELLSNRELQINFIRKMDDICGIKRAYYFAYGSNMLPERLLERIKKYHLGFKAEFPGYKFIYNKKSKDGTAKANVEKDDAAKVSGVCFEVDEEDLEILKKYEGGYDQRNIEVTDENRNKVKAITYISASVDNALGASTEYKSIVLSGAKHWGLSEEYISVYLS